MNALAKLDSATRMLAQVRSADDAKQVMDIAAAAEHYARKHRLGEEAIGHALSIKVEAHAMLGQCWKVEPKQSGARGLPGPGRGKKTATLKGAAVLPPTKKDRNLGKKEIEDGLLLATIKEEQPEEFEQIKAGKKKLTRVKRERTKAKVLKRVQEMPSGKFRIIYADPPWKYSDTLSGDLDAAYGGAEKHYPAMTIAELSALPVRERSEDNAVLFLWVTSPLLFESAAIFKAWGFTYKSAFIWDKVRHNMGHYNSVRHELLLICTRGQCTPDINKLFDSVQSIERTEKHSQKPEDFRTIIDSLYPYGRRVELFARVDVPKPWEKWGAEAG